MKKIDYFNILFIFTGFILSILEKNIPAILGWFVAILYYILYHPNIPLDSSDQKAGLKVR